MMRGDNITVNVAFAANQYINEKKYWMSKLSGQLPRSSFPGDYNRKVNKATTAETQLHPGKFKITGELFSKLIRASNMSDSRLFMILTTGLVILLHKYTGNEDIIIGTPIEKQGIEGEFINTVLVLRNHVHADMTFRELLMQVRQTITEACENQNYPLEPLKYDLNLQGDEEGAFPLLETAILLKNIHERQYIDHIDLKFIFSFLKTDECISAELEYKTSLYKKETIEKIFKHFIHLLRQAFINMNVDTRIVDMDILTEEEKNHLTAGLNSKNSEYHDSSTIHKRFETQVEKTPNHIAVKEAESNRKISYRELNEKSNQLADLLRKKGLERGMIAAIMGERTLEIIIGILAILKSGGCYLPLDAQYPDERITFILEESNVLLFLSQKPIVDQRQDIFRKFHPRKVLALDDEGIYSGTTANLDIDIQATDMAYVIYTSGTTGKPKGVIIEHKALVNYIHWAAINYVKNETADFPLYSSIAFDLTVTSVFTPLVTGNTIVVYSGWDKGNLIERIIDDNQVRVLKLTPSHLKLIREKPKENSQPGIRRFIVGGETLESQLALDIDNNFRGMVEIYNEYGPTEATVGCMLYKFNPREDCGVSVPIGIPADNTYIYLLDKHLNPVPAGTMGEIYISGAGLARGYLNRPELTAEKFLPVSPGFYRFYGSYMSSIPPKIYKTGDLGRWLTDKSRNIEFLGRIDQQVKIRGFRIELEEIENQLINHDHIKTAVVTAREDKLLCAYIVSDKKLAVTHLREYLSGKLPDYMVPSYFVSLDAVPLTPNGKVDMKALPEPGMKTEDRYVPPRNETESRLVEIWSELLGIDEKNIGIDTNFFELGGHSLSATLLLSKIHKAFNVKLLLLEIFKTPFIRQLSRKINTTVKENFVSIEPVEEREYYPLSPAQKRLYILQQIDLESDAFNIPQFMIMEGDLEKDKFEETCQQLVTRHEGFRTSFVMVADEPVQRVHKGTTFSILYYESDDDGSRKIIEGFKKPFDLGRAPLLRVGLVNIEQTKHILMVEIHHIVSDGISMSLVINEFMALYQEKKLSPLRLRYRDFSQWQNSEPEKEKLKKQEKYWLNKLKKEMPVLNLPTDYPRPVIRSLEGKRRDFEIGQKETKMLKKLALKEDASLFMVLLALYTIFLSKISGQEDIVIGTPAAGRGHTDLESIIGNFINTIIMRNYPAGHKAFKEFLHEVQADTLNSFENQDYQFDELVERIGGQRDTSRNPLFDVVLNFLTDEVDFGKVLQTDEFSLKARQYEYELKISIHDLTLSPYDAGETIFFSLEYCTKLFDEETIASFIKYFKEIVSIVVENENIKLQDIKLLKDLKYSETDISREDLDDFGF